MDKSEDAFRTISEAADELDLPQHVLRFWETRFTQIRPMKRGGGRRYYRPDDVALLRTIRHLLYNEGYTIRGVQRMLKERGVRAVLAMAAQAGPQVAPSQPGTESEARLEPARMDPVLAAQDVAQRHPALHAAPHAASIAASIAAPDAAGNAAQADELAWDAMNGGGRSAPAAAPAHASPAAPRAPSWTRAQRQALEAIAAELAECRRILTAANL